VNPRRRVDVSPLVLTAEEAGALVGYEARSIRALYRQGRFPSPIDPTLGARRWRWSRRAVEVYVEQGVSAVAS
jgi:predicted DNA-binding transcriptional regulator AlpA